MVPAGMRAAVLLRRAILPITDFLDPAILFLHLSLHFEVQLPFSFDLLLLHVTDDALVHGLPHILDFTRAYELAVRRRTALSARCW